jgi:hypothetical protein
VRMLTLGRGWVEAQMERTATWLVMSPEAGRLVVPGMSGSPIVSMSGEAIGVVSTNEANPMLVESLPVRLLRSINSAVAIRALRPSRQHHDRDRDRVEPAPRSAVPLRPT